MNSEKEKILVTGATGTVRSEVIKQLVSISTDNSIRAAVHSKDRADSLIQYENRGVEIVELDYAKPETIANALIEVGRQTLPVPKVTDICSNIVKEAKKMMSSTL